MSAVSNGCCESRCCHMILEDTRIHAVSLAVGLAFLALAIYFCCEGQMIRCYAFLATTLPFIAYGLAMIVFNKCLRKESPNSKADIKKIPSSTELGDPNLKTRETSPKQRIVLGGNNDTGMFFASFEDKMERLGFKDLDKIDKSDFPIPPQYIEEHDIRRNSGFITGKANKQDYVAIRVSDEELWVFAKNPNERDLENTLYYINGKPQASPFNDDQTLHKIKVAIAQTLRKSTPRQSVHMQRRFW